MSAVARRLNDQLPTTERTQGIAVVPLSLYVVGPQARSALWMLGGAVFCLFLIAAANVTSLSLARSAACAPEMAVRAALGANASRIVRQLLTESIVLASVSGVMGTLLAFGGIRLIRAFGPANLPRLSALSLTGIALGLVGAWWLGRAGSSLLFGVTASDPLTFTTASLFLTAVATAACYFPARRAMRVDPLPALRVT